MYRKSSGLFSRAEGCWTFDARDRTPRPSRATALHPVENKLRPRRALPSRASGFVHRRFPDIRASPFRSWNWREVHEPVHVPHSIGKKPDDNTGIVDPIDGSTDHVPQCWWCLHRTGGIVLVPISPIEDKTMHSVIVGGEKSDDSSAVIAAER